VVEVAGLVLAGQSVTVGAQLVMVKVSVDMMVSVYGPSAGAVLFSAGALP